MKIEVILIAETANCTLSQLRIDGQFQCFVLEDGYRQKKEKGVTRIPDGTYTVAQRTEGGFFEKYKKAHGHEFVPHLLDVPGFDYILIHTGNSAADTRGCLLVGHGAYKGPTGDFLLSAGTSTPAYKNLYLRLAAAYKKNEPVTITLNRTPVVVAAAAVLA